MLHNISQEEVEEGQVQYVLHGKDYEKNRLLRPLVFLLQQTFLFPIAVSNLAHLCRRMALTLTNVWGRAHVFH